MSIPFPPANPALGGFPPVPPPAISPGLQGVIGPQPQGFQAPAGMSNPMLANLGIASPGGMPGGMNPTMMFIMSEMQRMAAQEPTSAPDTKPKPPKGRKKPDLQEIEEKADAVVAMWAPRDNRMDEDLSLYRLTQDVSGAGEVVQKNTPYVVVEKAANMLAAQSPTIQVFPPEDTERDQAQKVENFLRWSWNRWNKRWRRGRSQSSLLHSMAHFLALRGWAAGRIWYNPDADPGREHPISFKLIDPRMVYPKFGEEHLDYVVLRYDTTYGEFRADWAEADKKFKDQKDTDTVTVTEYYDDWYHCIIVDGEAVKPPTAHEYGFIPWVIVTGYGSPIRITPVDQTTWVQEVGVSIFHGIKTSFKSLNKIMSQLATQIANAANPATLYYYDPNLNATPREIVYDAGTTNFLLYDRERVDPLNLNPSPADVSPVMDSLIDDIQKGTLPSILWGQGGTTSGFNTSMMTDAARDALFALVEAMEDMQEQVNEYTLMLVRDFVDADIGFWTKDANGQVHSGVTLAPEEVEAVGVENEVHYRDISPKDRATMAQLAAMLTDKKLISLETAREEYLLLDNPERENERVLYDLVNMDEDVVKKGLVPLALSQTDPALFQFYLMLKMAELQGNAQPQGQPALPPGLPAPQGPPGLPPTAAPPIAQPGANPLMQALGSALGGPGNGVPGGIPGAGALPLGMGQPGLPIGL